MTKGFVIMAYNNGITDYVKCAETLKQSILRVMPNANVTIITELPFGDKSPEVDWKLANDWQVYYASPYEHTIKLEADMFIPQSIEHWWDLFENKDIAVCTKIRNYKGELSNVRMYRQFIDDNHLPDTYNAITYFKKTDNAEQFFKIVRNVFENWFDWKMILRCNNEEIATTDWAYSIACHIMGEENTTIDSDQISMVHMKRFINDLQTDNWTNELLCEYGKQFKIATFAQEFPVHYQIKEYSKVLGEKYA